MSTSLVNMLSEARRRMLSPLLLAPIHSVVLVCLAPHSRLPEFDPMEREVRAASTS